MPTRLSQSAAFLAYNDYLNVECRAELTDHSEGLVVDVAAHLQMLLQGHRPVVGLVKLGA